MARTVRLLVSWLVLVLLRGAAEGRRCEERVYYVGIIEDFWDYAPSGKNLINGKPIAEDEHAQEYLENGSHRIGRVYKKAMYREFTDSSFTSQAPRPEWLGYLGPILRAEVCDTLVIHMKNFARRNFTMHPHGVFYLKNTEGALYPDHTSYEIKKDDSVPPGGSFTYRWEVKPSYGPTVDDANCVTWIYHSHIDSCKDVASGLVGPLITCKKGALKKSNPKNPDMFDEYVRNDVDKDYFMLFSVMDENMSWYLEDNVELCTDPDGVDVNDPDFQESNLMHSINGYMYGNLPGLEVCQYRAAAWHLAGLGNEVDIHSAVFEGNTLLDRGHRVDTMSLFPATFGTAKMIPKGRGKWLVSCMVNDHLLAGMEALYQVVSCGTKPSSTQKNGDERHYFLAAEKVMWNYAPTGNDLINNASLTEPDSASEVYFGKTGGRIGGKYMKVKYREYTDDTFTAEKPTSRHNKHLGLLGPVLRAEEGDVLKVTFMNKADKNFSIHPHGLAYEKRFQGTSYEDGVINKPGAHVQPGQKFTYTWQVLDGPSSSDPPCIPYLYYSASDATMDTNSGLFGPLLVCKRGALGKDGLQKGVDKEFFLVFSIMDENLSWYLAENIYRFGSRSTNTVDPGFIESNKMHAINGRMYGNLFGLDMCDGDKIVWYTFGLGSETDIHGVFLEGNTVKVFSNTHDTLSLFPHTSSASSMTPTSLGVHKVECRTTNHYAAGMRQNYKVKFCPGKSPNHKPQEATKVVQYYISAEEIEWDYSPSREWELEKFQTTADDSPGNIFVSRGPGRIGSCYKKAVYREYTDDTFSEQKERLPHQEHLEIMGPIIHGEVGEQIVITFKNKASRPYSISAYGVKASGAHVAVQPGQIIELTWDIPESSGPGPTDPNCISYVYYSTVDFVKDMFSGLLGPLIICRPGTLSKREDSYRYRKDINMEFALLFLIFDENQSWYLNDNIEKYLGVNPSTFVKDEDFAESNMMHGINGRVYGNLQGLVMYQGQTVDWYLLGMGNEVDIHTVHYHAETYTYKLDRVHRGDVYALIPGTFETVEMVIGNPGTWLLHCHVNDHMEAGMETTYTIIESSSKAASSNKPSLKALIFSLIAAKLGH